MKIIFCKYLKNTAEGFNNPVYPGKLGKKIHNNISKIAWKKWIIEQTKFINEKKLNMNNINDFNKVENYMINFLFHKNIKI